MGKQGILGVRGRTFQRITDNRLKSFIQQSSPNKSLKIFSIEAKKRTFVPVSIDSRHPWLSIDSAPTSHWPAIPRKKSKMKSPKSNHLFHLIHLNLHFLASLHVSDLYQFDQLSSVHERISILTFCRQCTSRTTSPGTWWLTLRCICHQGTLICVDHGKTGNRRMLLSGTALHHSVFSILRN